MKRLALLAALGTMLFGSLCFATDFRRAKPTLSDVHAASCRVRVSNASGSGLFIHYENEKCYFLTNHHVVESNGTATLDFWSNSVMQSVKGRVVSRYRNDKQNRDFAVIEVNAAELKKIDPPYIPLAPVEPAKLDGLEIMSAGGPRGRFVVSWRGKNGSYDGGIITFSPPPAHGQSGSGICAIIDGEIYAVATLTYLLGEEGRDSSKGGALPVINFANALYGRSSSVAEDTNATPRHRLIPVVSRQYSILAFTSDDCPYCVAAKPGLDQIARDGENVRIVDTSTSDGVRVANNYNVTETPTYLVVDATNKEVGRVTAMNVKVQGSYEALRIALVNARALVQEPAPEVDPEPIPVPPAEPKTTDEYKMDENNGVVISQDWETKKTLPVFITNPTTYDLNYEPVNEGKLPASVDLFKTWRNRNNGDEEESLPDATPIDPQEPEPKGWTPGDKIFDAMANRIEKKIDASVKGATTQIVNGLGTQVGEALNSVVGQVSDSIEENFNTKIEEKKAEIESKASAWWRGLVIEVICWGFVLIVLGVIAATVFMKSLRPVLGAMATFFLGGSQALANKPGQTNKQ